TAASTVAATVTVIPSKLGNLAESLKLEHQFVRVPFENYKKTIRANHRTVEKEVSSIISGISDADNCVISCDEAVQKLNSIVSRLQGFKRKLEEGSRSENLQAQKCRARLDHLESAEVDNLVEWNAIRLNRILVDYMLRMSYYNTASMLAEIGGIQDLVDIEVFHEAKKVIDALRRMEVAPALAWCSENKSRLKKSKASTFFWLFSFFSYSKFEFQLRLQEFIEMVRAGNDLQAIEYARRNLAAWGATHMKELQRVMVTLAVRSTTECATYKVLFDAKQWDFLVEQFKQEFCRLYGMTVEPLLNIYLQAGLSALKTPFSYEANCTKEDPLSQEGFRELSNPLPFSKQHHSKLVCYISKAVMDSENPPLVLPNGYVYSSKALEEMAKRNENKITCPRTGSTYQFSELVRAYIS
ncbi:hypothetical protein M569_03553, partial [Genlisea aurea]